MRQDADGDVADQFLSEPSAGHAPKRQRSGRERELPPLQVRSCIRQCLSLGVVHCQAVMLLLLLCCLR